MLQFLFFRDDFEGKINRILPKLIPGSAQTNQLNRRQLILDNGLRVLVVSDPLASLAGGSCDVGVGSYQDPPDIPG